VPRCSAPSAVGVKRHRAPQTVQPRLGQGTFRIAVTSAYGACAVSGEHSLPALEAAHVRPYAAGGEHALGNGLLLRADIHRLYDSGYVTVTPDHRFRVSGDLCDDFHNGREYERFAGREIAVPRARADWPDRERLEWHGAEVFRG
jgi:putative restriction endonuclease